MKWTRWRGTSRWYQVSPEPGLEAGEVRHADEQRPPGAASSAAARAPPRAVEVLEHVPESDGVDRVGAIPASSIPACTSARSGAAACAPRAEGSTPTRRIRPPRRRARIGRARRPRRSTARAVERDGRSVASRWRSNRDSARRARRYRRGRSGGVGARAVRSGAGGPEVTADPQTTQRPSRNALPASAGSEEPTDRHDELTPAGRTRAPRAARREERTLAPWPGRRRMPSWQRDRDDDQALRRPSI